MQKKNIVIIAATLLVLAAVAAYVFTRPGTASDEPAANQKSDPLITSNYYAEAKKTTSAGACLEEDTQVSITPDERTNVEYASMIHLHDVPAGTNVDIKIATYSETEVTGSDRYPDEYGSYNFTMTKKDSDWSVTTFQRCE